MISFIQNALRSYHTLIAEDKYADPRVKDMFLVSSPFTMVLIIGGYLYFCTKAGPRFMKDRRPYELKNVLIVYNFLQILVSIYLAQGASRIWIKHYDWFCEPVDYSDSPLNRKVLFFSWLYYIVKITELLDTVFFVLRKKFTQITFLHLFHHTLMPTMTWIGLRYIVTGGHGTMFGIVNSYVHIIMYGYYLVAGLGPEYQKYLWWKKHLTTLQLAQFGLIFIHNLLPLFSSCTYPKYNHILLLIFSGFFIYLFGNFYIQTYINKPKQQKDNKTK